jgi:FkbM family methyltransferase
MFLRFSSLRSALRRIPVFGGLLAWAAQKLLPRDSLIWVQIERGPAAGLWMHLNPRTGQIVQQASVEARMQQAIVEYLRPGMTFYDLGANIGFFSLLGARIVGSRGHVFSFEADPEIAGRLRENLARNNFANAAVEEKAVWSEPGSVSFARIDSNSSPDRGLGRVTSSASGESDQITVEATSLDHFALSYPPPDMLKCDVEGAEAAVFDGASRLLREHRPILLVEMHSAENHKLLTHKFSELGYSCRDLDENHVLALPQ